MSAETSPASLFHFEKNIPHDIFSGMRNYSKKILLSSILIRSIRNLSLLLSFFILPFFLPASELKISSGGRINTIDPALAADFISAYIVASMYDTLLEYDYSGRPYSLKPSMLIEMPKISQDMKTYSFQLREDLFFSDSGYFRGKDRKSRKIISRDVAYSFMRLADARLNSPGFWIFRGKIKGIDEFRRKSSSAAKDDMSIYEKPCEGIRIIDDSKFEIELNNPDPRFLYMLAMPYASIMSYEAGLARGNDFSDEASGSGPYILDEWIRDYKMTFLKNRDFRKEYFPQAESETDRNISLPFIDKITCYLVRQPLSGWLMFLRGELDFGGIDRENFDAVIDPSTRDINPALKNMGVKLVTTPEFQINYVGFSFTDKKLAGNIKLRKAISLAYNTETRIIHSNYSLRKANGPIPPGVAGYDDEYLNPYSVYNPDQAKRLLAEAGYPEGIDLETGKNLEFSFDLGDTSSYHRQIAELMVDDMKKIGIKINPVLNNKPRFFQKLSDGQMQLFRISWVGDYPDAENFLQLFYGANAGKSNRVFYRDKFFDSQFEEVIGAMDSPERTRKYSAMAKYITEQCPWIFESSPVTYQLVHGWVENFIPHNFANGRWKYLSINEKKKTALKKKISPVKF